MRGGRTRGPSRRKITKALRRGHKTFTQLSKETRLSDPALAENLAWLEKSGEIAHRMHPNDRRSKIYHITLKGWEDSEKEVMKENIDMTPLIINKHTLQLEVDFPEWYVKRKGWDDPKKAPPVLQTVSHISPFIELQERSSKVLKSFRSDVYHQLKNTMSMRYPETEKRELDSACKTMTDELLRILESRFNLSIFSSLKMKPMGTSRWKVWKAILPSSPITKDYYAETYIDLFEYFIGLLHETLKNDSVEESFLGDTQGKKIMFMMELDLSTLSALMKELEEMHFRPEEFEEKVKRRFAHVYADPL